MGEAEISSLGPLGTGGESTVHEVLNSCSLSILTRSFEIQTVESTLGRNATQGVKLLQYLNTQCL